MLFYRKYRNKFFHDIIPCGKGMFRVELADMQMRLEGSGKAAAAAAPPHLFLLPQEFRGRESKPFLPRYYIPKFLTQSLSD